MRRAPPERAAPAGSVLIVTAGTSDLGVAEEAELTASLLGAETEIVADVGVAGLHRLAAVQPMLAAADAVVVIAGHGGRARERRRRHRAVSGDRLPDERRLRASLGGLAALLSMLSSCAPGVACVNVDDGVGAGHHRRDDRSAVRPR